MSTAPDALSRVAGTGPSLLGAGLRAAAVTAAVALALWLLARYSGRFRRGRRLEVLDRAVLGRAASIALVRVDDSRLLVGVSAEGVRLLRDLDARPSGRASPSFALALDDARSKTERQP